MQKGLEDKHGAEELFPISHIDIFFLCAISGRSQRNACMPSKRKVDSETKIYTYLLSLTDEVWGACERRGMLQLATNDTTIFMHYAENLHSLRLGFKTFYKRNAVKNPKLARKSRKWQKLWFQIATNKSMQNARVRATIRLCCSEANEIHAYSKRCANNFWIVWKGWACAVHFRLELASTDLVINGDFSRASMHIMRSMLSGPQFTVPNQAVKS